MFLRTRKIITKMHYLTFLLLSCLSLVGNAAEKPNMRETWFGPLIGEVEQRIQLQMGGRWDRELFEQHLTGFTMRTNRYRLVLWKDRRDLDAEPLFVELFDHESDPKETQNVAANQPELVQQLIAQHTAGWEAAR